MAESKWTVGDRVAMRIDPEMVGDIVELREAGHVIFKPDNRTVETSTELFKETNPEGSSFAFHEDSFVPESV